jgi:hypothetical protein
VLAALPNAVMVEPTLAPKDGLRPCSPVFVFVSGVTGREPEFETLACERGGGGLDSTGTGFLWCEVEVLRIEAGDAGG